MKFIKYIVLIIVLLAIAGYFVNQKLTKPNLSSSKSNEYFYVDTDSNSEDIIKNLIDGQWVDDAQALSMTAQVMQFNKSRVYPGRYHFDSLSNTRTMLTKLRRGEQTAVKLIINNVRTYKDLAGSIAKQLEVDSLTLIKLLESKQSNKDVILTQFIPDTYNVYWNTTPEKLLERIDKESMTYWNADGRSVKAKKLGLNKDEVYTLASIVEKETNYNPEKKRVAGVYLNRIKKGMLLQADPTVVFANNDFTIKRVLNKHLAKKSPYNTYLNIGLPPGPIYMPSKSSIDAVLNAESHNYLYFCAKADNSGQHAFAKNLQGHNKNAQVYRRWLTNNGY